MSMYIGHGILPSKKNLQCYTYDHILITLYPKHPPPPQMFFAYQQHMFVSEVGGQWKGKVGATVKSICVSPTFLCLNFFKTMYYFLNLKKF